MLKYIAFLFAIFFVGFGTYFIGYNTGRHAGRKEMNESNKQAYKTQLQSLIIFSQSKDYKKIDVFLRQELLMCGKSDFTLGQLTP